jgi:hypothetical protein
MALALRMVHDSYYNSSAHHVLLPWLAITPVSHPITPYHTLCIATWLAITPYHTLSHPMYCYLACYHTLHTSTTGHTPMPCCRFELLAPAALPVA